ncbi:hypothetical protein FQJ93_16890 [Xanthomonas vasicola]|uniref:Uncharacterized protein n=1 Tax=Xanthomonas vasicola TaxID=56459 RepID=A0ABD7SBE5_XANVA|nr:hypothetical protein FQJ97_22150 [Xanthomonas vasicola]TWQ35574.1 hypothetical protein FQJ96_17395 [Xanthomonas vasicola]TWQ52253.1 hypothetical protein FQK01_13135 [Xanthomonas vasicola]TWQ55957.1 hypothetical protein FQJ93_16890 [Xanthomonas vasicola]TWR02186.1 hypothetical protein FQJ87_16780 [Xanthomonas vasicola]
MLAALKKIDPLTFHFKQSNFVPMRDLNVLFVRAAEQISRQDPRRRADLCAYCLSGKAPSCTRMRRSVSLRCGQRFPTCSSPDDDGREKRERGIRRMAWRQCVSC